MKLLWLLGSVTALSLSGCIALQGNGGGYGGASPGGSFPGKTPGSDNGGDTFFNITPDLLAIADNGEKPLFACQTAMGEYGVIIKDPSDNDPTPNSQPLVRVYEHSSEGGYRQLYEQSVKLSQSSFIPGVIYYSSADATVPDYSGQGFQLRINGTQTLPGKSFVRSVLQLKSADVALNLDPFYCKPVHEKVLDEMALYWARPHDNQAIVRVRGLDAATILSVLSGRSTDEIETQSLPTVKPEDQVFQKGAFVCGRRVYTTGFEVSKSTESPNCSFSFVTKGEVILPGQAGDQLGAAGRRGYVIYGGDLLTDEMRSASRFRNGEPGSLYLLGLSWITNEYDQTTVEVDKERGGFNMSFEGLNTGNFYFNWISPDAVANHRDYSRYEDGVKLSTEYNASHTVRCDRKWAPKFEDNFFRCQMSFDSNGLPRRVE